MLKLLEPGKIGNMRLKNRTVMLAMGIGSDADGGINERAINFYTERAKGGIGMVITGIQLVSDKFEPVAGNLLNKVQHMGRLAHLCSNVQNYGAKLCVQLCAGFGRLGFDPSAPPLAPSVVPCFWFPDIMTREYSIEQIKELVKDFGYSAQLAMRSGADAVELHAYGGYLMDQFQSSLWNKRTDEYGGDLKGRMKFSLEIIAEIKKNCGDDFPIIVKHSMEHGIPGGRTMDEGVEMARMFETAGIHALQVDLGSYERWNLNQPTVYQKDAFKTYAIKIAREAVNIPIIANGKLSKPQVAEAMLQDGHADFIGLAKQMLADPYWVNKIKQGAIYDIRRCAACSECMHRGFKSATTNCAVNPALLHESEYALTPVEDKGKRILVVGGGPGGMQAAITASERGIKTELWEKGFQLGGTLIAAGTPSFKSDIMDYVEYAANKLYRSGAVVRLMKEATVEEIAKHDFDAVIVAAGTTHVIPPIPGVEQEWVLNAIDVLTGAKKTGEKCVVIGGGLVGCETALSIQRDMGKEALILEELDGLLLTVEHAMSSDMALRDLLAEEKINSICGAKVTAVEKGYVVYEKDGKHEKAECDTVVLACGYQSDSTLADKLSEKGIEVYSIGDYKAPRKIFEAVHEAYHTVRLLFEEAAY